MLNEAIAQVSRQTGWSFELADRALGEMRAVKAIGAWFSHAVRNALCVPRAD
jgi:hypothetical protein